jgi:hypothetical protein
MTRGGELGDLAEGAGRIAVAGRGDPGRRLPKRSGFAATTIVLVASGFFCASRLRARISAWLLSHDCATKTASSPKRTATPIMTMVLVRTTLSLRLSAVLLAANIASRPVANW